MDFQDAQQLIPDEVVEGSIPGTPIPLPAPGEKPEFDEQKDYWPVVFEESVSAYVASSTNALEEHLILSTHGG